MHDPVAGAEMSSKLHLTSGIGRSNKSRTCSLNLRGFSPSELGRGIGTQEAVDPSSTTAKTVGVDLDGAVPRGLQYLSRGSRDSLRMPQVARVLHGYQASIRRKGREQTSVDEIRDHLDDVTSPPRQVFALGVDVSVVLEMCAASGSSCDDHVHAGKRLDVDRSETAGGFQCSVVRSEGTTAGLCIGKDNLVTGSREELGRRPIDPGKPGTHHTAAQEADGSQLAIQRRALVQTDFIELLGSELSHPGEGSPQPRGNQPIQPQYLDGFDGQCDNPDHCSIRKDPTQHEMAKRASEGGTLSTDLGPRAFHGAAERHHARANRLAGTAIETESHRVFKRRVEFDDTIGDCVHRRDPAPGRCDLETGQPKRRTMGQAEPALDA